MNLKHFQPLSPRLIVSLVLAVLVFSDVVWAEDFLNDESYTEKTAIVEVFDPIEPFNRAVFTVNDKMFMWVLNPVATAYSKVLPVDIRGCVGNFFYNLGEPVRSVNCLLQGRFRESGSTISRFFINTTAGVFGLADPASREFKMPRVKATFGQTFSVWGVGDGFYVVVPLLGPSTLRDFSGDIAESFLTASYHPWNNDIVTSTTVTSVQYINYISLHLGMYEDLKSMSFDPYVAFRNAYFQSRNKMSDHVILSSPTLSRPTLNINK
jgi:phospholipid-binding lipoprotein MlaA